MAEPRAPEGQERVMHRGPLSLRRRVVVATAAATAPLVALVAYLTYERYAVGEPSATSHLGVDLLLILVVVGVVTAVSLVLAAWVVAPLRRVGSPVPAGGASRPDLAAVDIEIRKRDEIIEATRSELSRRTERLEALHTIDRALLGAETPAAIARAATSRLREVTGAVAATVVTLDADHRRATVLALATAGPAPVAVGTIVELDGQPFAPRQLVDASAIQIDVEQVKTSALLNMLRKGGVKSCVAAPLVAQGELLGAVALGFTDAATTPPDVLAITTEVAAQLALAMRHASLRAELEAVVDGAFDGMLVVDSLGRIVAVNEMSCDLFGLSRDALLAKCVDDVLPGSDEAGAWARLRADGRLDGVFTVDLPVGRRTLEVRGRADIMSARHLFVVRDVSERHRLEDQLRQAQKLEAIGRLAGGVAHDFNNLLTVMSGYSSLARARVGSGPGSEELRGLDDTLQRAADLTRQLLTFSRQQVHLPVVLSIKQVVRELLPIVSRLVGDDITIAVVDDAEPSLVRADRSQIEQVVLNLVVNARDAMPEGGVLTIDTHEAILDETYTANHPGVVPGAYVCVEVTDSGVGMDADVQARMFEPFYTTKKPGCGTGLGLATVHGIVTQTQGHVHVYSELGLGTTVKVFLPLVGTPAALDARSDIELRPAARGSETILLCEDDELVRSLTERVLGSHGYHVLAASEPRRAFELAAEHPEIDVVVTDVVMPGLSGPELVERLRVHHPDLRVLFLSGYPVEVVRRRADLPAGSAFLEKPFHAERLLRAIRSLLEPTSRPVVGADPRAAAAPS